MTIVAETPDRRTPKNWTDCPAWCDHKGIKEHNKPDYLPIEKTLGVRHEGKKYETRLVTISDVEEVRLTPNGVLRSTHLLMSFSDTEAVETVPEELRELVADITAYLDGEDN